MIPCDRFRRVLPPTLAVILGILLTSALFGCEHAAIEANAQQVNQQQQQIEQNQMEIQKLLAEQGQSGATSSAAPARTSATRGCDKSVMADATRRAGQKMSAGDFTRAVGYYQDALTACPKSARAQVNLARAEESAGNRSAAIQNYRAASRNTNPSESSAVQEALIALTRLGAK